MLLHRSTWPEIERYLSRSRGIIVPLGSIEQHGPSGLIGTDALCAEAVANRAGEIADALVAPVIAYGVAPFNLGFAGTITLRASTFIRVLHDCLASLARHGFTRIYCLNGHGGNVAPAQAAFSELYAGASLGAKPDPVPRCRLISWWQYPRTNTLRTELYADREGLHATPSEVSITWHLHPDREHRVDMPALAPLDADTLRALGGDRHYDAEHHRRCYPDGRIGSAPELSTASAGARLLELAAEEAAADYRTFVEGG